MAELCREHDIADSLLRRWREQFLAAGAERRRGKTERTEADDLRRQIARLERALGSRTMEVEVAGPLAGLGVSVRVARSRELVAQGRPAAVVSRVAGISRQAIYRRPGRPPTGQRRALDATDRIVLDIARSNPTDGTPMVAALAARRACEPVNRKRVQRLREHALLRPKRSEGRRRRPGYFQVTRPDEQAIPRVCERSPGTAVVILTTQDDPSFARHALDVGALGNLLKDAANGELVTAVRRAADGDTYLPQSLGAALAGRPREH
jgi:hypothetical protein